MSDRYAKCAAQHMGTWLIEPGWMSRTVAAYKSGTLPTVEQSYWEGAPYEVIPPGIAAIEIAGHITKGESSFGGTSSVATRKAIRQAVADPAVSAILLSIDSPGGTVAGTPELANEVRAANTRKKVYAYIADMGASAAYWVAAQARSISANATAEIGSIGVFSVIEDSSAMAEQLGIKVHVISSGPFKGVGVPGTPVSDEAIAAEQETVNTLTDIFIDAVSLGRGLDTASVRALATGQTWIGAKAKKAGLVDKIEPYEDTVARIADEITSRQARRTKAVDIERHRLSMG